jgi:uncharacterized protein (TIGR02145 family)
MPSSSSEIPSSSSISSCTAADNTLTQYCYNGTLKDYIIITDSRDQKTYKAVEIGTQVWMAENLNYNASGSVYYNNDENNYGKYGRFYNWATAMGINTSYNTSLYKTVANHKGICPTGWHIPSDAEWNTLIAYVHSDNGQATYTSGTSSVAGKYLKANSILWSNNTGTDDYGFAALPGGYGSYSRKDGSLSYSYVGSRGAWWGATNDVADYACGRQISGVATVNASDYNKIALFNIRCVKD